MIRPLLVPLPPSVNNAYYTAAGRMTAQGKATIRRKTPELKAWLDAAGWEMREQLARPLDKGWYEVAMAVPADMSGDVDNRQKAVLDLMVKMHLTPDDRWLWRLSITRSQDVPAGKMRVEYRNTTPERKDHANPPHS